MLRQHSSTNVPTAAHPGCKPTGPAAWRSALILAALALDACGNNPTVVAHGTTTCAGGTEIPNSLEQVLSDSDVTLEHEGRPHGVPTSYDWYSHPIRHELTTTPADVLDRYHAMVGWGQIYEDDQGSKSVNTRVQLRNFQTWYHLRDPTGAGAADWLLAGPGVVNVPDAAWYNEDFATDISHQSDHTALGPDMGGGVSALPGDSNVFHFYPHGREPVGMRNVDAVFTTAEMRLIRANAALPDDCNKARFMADMGVDVYESESDSPGIAPAIAQGRFRYVTKDWQWFSVIDSPNGNDPAWLDEHPPPPLA